MEGFTTQPRIQHRRNIVGNLAAEILWVDEDYDGPGIRGPGVIRAVLSHLDPRAVVSAGIVLQIDGLQEDDEGPPIVPAWSDPNFLLFSAYPLIEAGGTVGRGTPAPTVDAIQVIPTRRYDGSIITAFAFSLMPMVDRFEMILHKTVYMLDHKPFDRMRVYFAAFAGPHPAVDIHDAREFLERIQISEEAPELHLITLSGD